MYFSYLLVVSCKSSAFVLVSATSTKALANLQTVSRETLLFVYCNTAWTIGNFAVISTVSTNDNCLADNAVVKSCISQSFSKSSTSLSSVSVLNLLFNVAKSLAFLF